ncbi:MAG: single-stranded DNA-binding protein [Thermoleophilia bacterium]|nr:single-stranded DNA-binding protein [Thermoleophilia bacterium]
MAGDINRVTLVGRLTRDPELKHLASGSAVLELGLAVNGRKQDAGGQWVDKPNFFDVKVFGNQAEMLSQNLAKGRRIGVDGRLDWSSWESADGGKRSKVEVIAQSVQFLDSRGDGDGGGSGGGGTFIPATAAPQSGDDFPSSPPDDIPF